MAKKIFEESKVKLSLKVTNGKPTEKTAEFTLLCDGAEHSKSTANLNGSSFAWPTTAPKIDDPKVKKWPYELKYRVKHEGKTFDSPEEWEVWPKTLTLEPKGNDAPAQLKVLQNEKVVTAPPKIAKDGSATVTLNLPAEATVQSAFPWKVKDGGVTDSGRTRTVQLEKIPYQVKFVMLDGGDADTDDGRIKQLVNAKTENGKGLLGNDHKGELIELNVKVKGVDPAKYEETAGTVVYVRATFSNKTKRDDPKFPRKLEVDELVVAGDVHTGTVKLDKSGFAKFTLHFGLAGGERCKVEIGTSNAYGDATKYFETWRQLHFQISHPAGAKPDPADFVTSYEEVKVKMVEEPAGSIAAGSGPKGAWINGDDVEVGMGRQALIIGLHNEKKFHKQSFKNKNDAKYAHFLICDFQFDAGPASMYELQLENKHLVGGGPQAAFGLRDIEKVFKLLPMSIKDGKDAVRKLSYRVPSTKRKGKITTYTVDYANNHPVGGKITFTLPAEVVQDHTSGETVYISVSLHLVKGPFNGSSTKNLLLIAARNNSGARPDSEMNKTMVHETGHALMMCAKNNLVIPGIADVKAEHTRSYFGRGHTGSHCAKGIPDAVYNSGQDLDRQPGTCVIYGEGGNSRTRSYCDLCQKLLLPAALDEYWLEKL